MLVVAAAVAHFAVRVHGVNVCTGGYFGAVAYGGGGQGRGHRAHPADGHVPVPAEHVIQEADVLPQRRVVEASEGADQRVGGDHAADQVVAHRVGDGVPDRLIDNRVPRCRRVGHLPGRAAGPARG